MNKMQNAIFKKAAKVIKQAAINGADSTCWWEYYQPKVPDQLREKTLKE